MAICVRRRDYDKVVFYSRELRRMEAWVAWRKSKAWEVFLISQYFSLILQSWEGLFPCLTHTSLESLRIM